MGNNSDVNPHEPLATFCGPCWRGLAHPDLIDASAPLALLLSQLFLSSAITLLKRKHSAAIAIYLPIEATATESFSITIYHSHYAVYTPSIVQPC